MTTLIQFKKGDILFRQGDVSYHVLRVRSGEIEVLREIGATSVLIGHARDGEWLGEMGVIEGRSRSATARAVTDGEGEVLTAQQFLERVSSDSALAHDLILRLSVRLVLSYRIRLRHAAEEIECRHMAIAKGFRCFGRIRLDETAIRVRQIHAKIMEPNLLATNIPVRLAKIRLRVAWAMAQWHEHLPPPKHRLCHIPAHDRVATSKPLLIP